MASPSMTQGAAGGALASATIAASGTRTFTVDASSVFEAQVGVAVTFGTVTSPAGLKVEAFEQTASTPVYETQASISVIIAATASTTQRKTIVLSTGKWQVVISNLDASNTVTATQAAVNTVDSIQ